MTNGVTHLFSARYLGRLETSKNNRIKKIIKFKDKLICIKKKDRKNSPR